MIDTHNGKPRNGASRFNEAVQMYLDGRRDGAPDAILVALADEVIEATAEYTGVLWDICQLQNEVIRKLEGCRRDSI